MKKILIIVCIIVAVFIFTMFWAWGEILHISQLYYEEALDHYDNGEYMFSIKGTQKLKTGYQGQYLSGGLQHIIQAWEKTPGWLKPEIENKAKKTLDYILNEKMTMAEAEKMLQFYFGYENTYLDRVCLRLAQLYYESNRIEDAVMTYEYLIKNFKYSNKKYLQEAEKKLNDLKSISLE